MTYQTKQMQEYTDYHCTYEFFVALAYLKIYVLTYTAEEGISTRVEWLSITFRANAKNQKSTSQL